VMVCGILLMLSASLFIFLTPYTRWQALIAVTLALIYPWMKRYTHLPQCVLAAAFNWAIVMVYAQIQGSVSAAGFYLFILGFIWTVLYDTQYGMVDRDDDVRIGVKSTAILFGRQDVLILNSMHVLLLLGWIAMGIYAQYQLGYYVLILFSGLLAYQQYRLYRTRQEVDCFRAFKQNFWYGLVIFVAILFR